MSTLAQLLISLGLDAAGVEKGTKEAEGSLGRLSGAGDKMGLAVTAAAVAGGAAIGDFAVTGVQEFAKFEKGMNEVFTLMPGMSAEAMGAMKADVKDLANETGVLPDEIIPALYNSLSAGVPADNVFEFLREANKTAVAGATDVGVAVDALTSVTNAYGSEVLSASDAGDILFTGVKQGKTTLDELGGAMSTVAPLAAGLGVGFDEVVSAMAAMTSQGEPTAGTATKLRALMAELSQPTSKIGTLFQELAGQSFPDFIAGGGTVQEALQMIGAHAQVTGRQANTLANSVEAGMALMMLTSETGANQFGANMDAMAERTGAVDTAYSQMAQGVEHQTGLIVAKIRTMALDIGEFMAPLGPLFMAFGPNIGRWMGRGLGALGGFLATQLTKVVGGAWTLAQKAIAPLVTAAGTAGGAVYSKAVSVAQALGAALSSAWGTVKGVATRAIAAAGAVAGGVYSTAAGAVGALASALSGMWGRLKANRAIALAAGAAGAAAGAIYGAAVAASSAFANALSVLWHALPGNARITGALTTAGTKMGALMGGAMAAAIPLALIGIGVAIAKVVGDEMAQALRKLREEIDWELVPPENVQQVRDAGTAVEHYGNAVGLLVPFLRDAGQETVGLGRDMQSLGQEATETAQALRSIPTEWLNISQLNEDFGSAGSSSARAFASHFDSSLTSELGNTGERMPGVVEAAMKKQGWEFAAAQGRQVMSDFARGLAEDSRKVVTALDDLRWILENGLSPADQAAIVKEKGGEWITLFRQGMASEVPGAVEQAQKVGIEGLTALANANQLDSPRGSKRSGEIVTELYASGISGQALLATLAAQGVNRDALITIGKTAGWDEAGVDAALAWINGVESRENAAGDAGDTLNRAAKREAGDTTGWDTAGRNVANAWATAFTRQIARSKRSFDAALATATMSYRGLSPPKEGPLRRIDDWGENIAAAWGGGFVGGIRDAITASKRALTGLAGSLSGQPAFTAAAAPAAGGDVININIHGPIYGGPAGLDQLVREIDERVRFKRRSSTFG